MSLKLDDIDLPDDLEWIDRGQPSWTQNTERLVDNRLFVEETPYLGGMPITLQSRDDFAFISDATLSALQGKLVQGAEMVLSGLTVADIDVTWRLSDGYPIEWAPVAYPIPKHRITLRFITLEA